MKVSKSDRRNTQGRAQIIWSSLVALCVGILAIMNLVDPTPFVENEAMVADRELRFRSPASTEAREAFARQTGLQNSSLKVPD